VTILRAGGVGLSAHVGRQFWYDVS